MLLYFDILFARTEGCRTENSYKAVIKEFMNLFRDVIGQQNITLSLSGAIFNNKLHHAYLFSGPAGVGKEAAALELIKIVNCLENKTALGYCGECASCRQYRSFTSDDLLYIFPTQLKAADSDKVIKEKSDMVGAELREKASTKGYHKFSFKSGRYITLAQIDEIKYFARFNSINKSKKFVIIHPCELMNKEAQNSLLKILEEPPANLYFILISENPSSILDTIRSRCLNIEFPPLKESDIKDYIEKYHPGTEEGTAAELAANSFGSTDTLRKLISESGGELKRLHSDLTGIFAKSLPPETISLMDSFIEEIKELSDTETDYIFRKTLETLLNDTYGNEKKSSLQGRSAIMTDFERFGIMYRRNINPRLLLINLYLNFREEYKKWQTKQKET
jgi:DNA polymerase III delta' subunit